MPFARRPRGDAPAHLLTPDRPTPLPGGWLARDEGDGQTSRVLLRARGEAAEGAAEAALGGLRPETYRVGR